MPLEANGTAPYTTANAAVTAISAFRDRGMGSPVTTEVLVRSGVPESISSRTLNSLKLLDLIGDNGEPTQQFQDLRQARGEEEYRARLQEWIRSVYAEVLQYTNPATDSPERVAEAFRSYEPAGQRRGMAALLIGLWKLAGLTVPDGGGPPRPAVPRARRPAIRKATGEPRLTGTSSMTVQGEASTPDLPPALVGLLRQIPHDGGSWTSKRRDDFMGAFKAVLDFTVPVDDNPTPVSVLEDPEEDSP